MTVKSYVVKGLAKWAKIVGPAPAGYDNGPAEWSVDLILNPESKAHLLSTGVDKFYVKTNKEGEEFIRFTRKAEKRDGTTGTPIRIVDHQNNDWGTQLIGNGSTLNVCYCLNEVKSKGTKRMKPSILSVQVWDHVKYKPKGPFETRKDAPATFGQDEQSGEQEWDGN